MNCSQTQTAFLNVKNTDFWFKRYAYNEEDIIAKYAITITMALYGIKQ